MKGAIAILISFVLYSFVSTSTKQVKEILFYIKEKGLYIQFNSGDKKTKVPYKEKWDFYFSLKNDSTAIVQDVKKGINQASKEYRISSTIDTAFIRRYRHGDTTIEEKVYYKTVY
jgi:hypothetical protein